MKRSIDLLLLVFWIAVIFFLTGFPSLESPKIREIPIDKFYHFLLFFVYGILGLRVLNLGIYFVSGILIVITAETQQIFIPGRDFEFFDIIAGFIGLLAVYAIYIIKKGRH